MKKLIIIISILLLNIQPAFSHSGGTDKNGGHNCSQKSKNKGLCTGYHYHNPKGEFSNSSGSDKKSNLGEQKEHTHGNAKAHSHN